MVDALLQAWRTLRSGGILIDLRPFTCRPPVDVLDGDERRRAGRVDDTGGQEDDDAADEAIMSAVELGYFAKKEQRTFPFAYYWDSIEGMVEYIEDRWSDTSKIPPGTLENARRFVAQAQGKVTLRVTNQLMIAQYTKSQSSPLGQT